MVALLPWLGVLFDTAEFPGGWKFKFRELESRTDELQKEVEKTRGRIDDLLVSGMSPLAVQNLRKIASGLFGPYFWDKDSVGAGSFCKHWIRLIQVKGYRYDEIPQNGHQRVELHLSDFVEITQLGQSTWRYGTSLIGGATTQSSDPSSSEMTVRDAWPTLIVVPREASVEENVPRGNQSQAWERDHREFRIERV